MKLSSQYLVDILIVVTGIICAFGLPLFLDLFTILQLTVFGANVILALSLGFIWGFGGILCFGHAVFFGLGAYVYAIAAINIGESTLPLLISIALPCGFAAALGYFMFYGKLNDVYMAVVTFVVSLIFFSYISTTSGQEYRIGKAPLGGFNGIPGIRTLNIPGRADILLSPEAIYALTVLCAVLIYTGLRLVLRSHWGLVIVSVRENEMRAELLGYDTRLCKLITFTVGGAIAGLAGCLYANWGGYVSPNLFNLSTSAQILIWVIVGGVGTLIGPIVGCLMLQIIITYIGARDGLNSNLVIGLILIVFVLAVPSGIIPTLKNFGQVIHRRWNQKMSGRIIIKPESSDG